MSKSKLIIPWGKIELNVLDDLIEIDEAVKFVVDKKLPAIVISDPSHIPFLQHYRTTVSHRFSIITAIDFDNGDNFAIDKFKNLPQEVMGSDGFDILLTARNEILTRNEIEVFRNWLADINPYYSIRYVLGAFVRPYNLVDNMLKHIRLNPPRMIRLDHNLEISDTKADLATVKKIIGRVRQQSALPIKFGTNLTLDKIFDLNSEITYFDVSYELFRDLLKIEKINKEERTPFEDPIENKSIKINATRIEITTPNELD